MRKFWLSLFCGVLFVFFIPLRSSCALSAFAQTEEKEEVVIKTIEEEIENLDLDNLEQYYEELNLDSSFNSSSIKELVYGLISGKESLDISSIIKMITNSITGNISSIIRLVISIMVIVLLSKFAGSLISESSSKTIVNYITLLILLGLLAYLIKDSLYDTVNSIYIVKDIMEVVFPILLSLLCLIGASGASMGYQPVLVLLVSGVVEIFAYILSAVVILYFVLSVLSSITDYIKLNKLKAFLASFYKTTIGIVFTIFIGYISLAGITSSVKDGISIKTAKYALRSYLPLVGGYVSDSYELFRAGSILIKNSVGMVGIILIFSAIIYKVLNLTLYSLGFKLIGALTEPFGESKLTEFLSSLGTVFKFLIASIVSVFMMCFIGLLLIISTANTI